jgi:hypothetical protein
MFSILILIGFCIAQIFAAGIPHGRAPRCGNGTLPSLDQTSLEELQCGMDRGDFTAADLVEVSRRDTERAIPCYKQSCLILS